MNLKILFLSFLILSCSFKSKKDQSSSQRLNLSLASKVPTLDPALAYDAVSWSILGEVQETLYTYDYQKRPYEIIPYMAKELPTISKDGMTYTIRLKPDLYYYSSEFKEKKKVKAEDFIHQLKRIAFKPTQSSGWWLLDEKIKGINEFREKAGNDAKKLYSLNIEGLQAPDDETLIIQLTKPNPQLIYALAMPFTTPVPADFAKTHENNLSLTPLSTGPYYIDTYDLKSKVVLKKNPNYRHETFLFEGHEYPIPATPEVEFQLMEESQTRWLNYLRKKIDIVGLSKDHIPLAIDSNGSLNQELRKQGMNLLQETSLTFWWISFNMSDSILGKNKNLRLAVAHAIDLEKMRQLFTQGTAIKASSIYPPSIAGHKENKLPFFYNLEKAKKFLNEAGYPDGKGLPVFQFDVRGSDTNSRQMAEFIEQQLEKVGIKIQVNLNQFSKFIEKANKGQLQLWLDGWTLDYPDAENILHLLLTRNHPPGQNSTSYSNPKVDELFNEYNLSQNENEKLIILSQIELLVMDDLPWILQYYSVYHVLTHGNIKNYRPSDLINNGLRYIIKE